MLVLWYFKLKVTDFVYLTGVALKNILEYNNS